jgi:hypothetical protein
MIHIESFKKVKIHISYSTQKPPPAEIVPLMGNVDKYHTARQATRDDTMLHRKDALCMPDN